MAKYLIVNADDFGLTKGINQGIIKSFKEGIVKSASILAVGRAYDDAVALAEKNPKLDIGIHLCLTEEKPILTKKEIPGLIGKDGNFLKSRIDFIIGYILGRIRLLDIEKELDAQIRKVLESGIRPTHLDSHGYIHMLPQVLKTVMKLAKKYHIPFVRYPYERLTALKDKLSRHILRFGLNMLCLFSKQSLRKQALLKIEGFYGFLNSGHFFEECLTKTLKALDGKLAELVCHPGICDEEIERYNWRYAWEEELKVLTSKEIKKLIEDLNIELVSFRDTI